MTDTHTLPYKLPKARLEALVDGIFAIAMTILVLEVKLPNLQNGRSSEELFRVFGRAWPTVAAYFFSFALLGIFWVWHHRLAARIKELDAVLIACSLVFLALVSFFPFVAGVYGHYPMNPASMAVYFPVVGLIMLSQTALFWLALRRGKVWEDLSEAEALNIHRKNLRGFLIFCIGAAPGVLRIGVVPGIVVLALAALAFIAMKRT